MPGHAPACKIRDDGAHEAGRRELVRDDVSMAARLSHGLGGNRTDTRNPAAAGDHGKRPAAEQSDKIIDRARAREGHEVRPAITFPYAGLASDADARVLGANGPIPGLLTGGVDAGGVYKRGYAGALARGLVFGMRAGLTAASEPSWRA